MRKWGKSGAADGGLGNWVWARIVQPGLPAGWKAPWRRAERSSPRLKLIERIPLAPRQSLALVEAEGRRLLVATSGEGAAAFHVLDEPANRRATRGQGQGPGQGPGQRSGRVSW